ncbi:MAG: hypothetical protein J0L75_07970 [Spirochaetes bacterium]|nr:hypothetical protein [Spirochaetota bacterium]
MKRAALRILAALLAAFSAGFGYYVSEDFNAPIGAPGTAWRTNFCYGRDGTVSSSSLSVQAADSIVSGKLAFRGWTCDNAAFNGFWSTRGILHTNTCTPTPEKPFGWEIVREVGLLDYDSGSGIEKFNQVLLGMAFYADPDQLVTEVFDNSATYNFQNGASWFDFGDYEGYADIALQKIGYYYGADRSLTNELFTARRPGGVSTNVTNLFLRKYRTAGSAPLLLLETFSNFTPPPGWDWGSNAGVVPGVSYSGFGTNCLVMPSNAWVTLPPLSRIAHMRMAIVASNTGGGQPIHRIQVSTNGTNGPWLLPHQGGNYQPCNLGANSQNNFYDTTAVATFIDEGLWNTNVTIRITSQGTNSYIDYIRVYGATTPNTNALGFRLTHDGSLVSMWVNPNPYGNAGLPFPNEWLFLKSEPVLFSRALQMAVYHAQRMSSRPNWYEDNRYAHGNFDRLLARSATDGTGFRTLPTPGGFWVLITNALSPDTTAGVNHVRLRGHPGWLSGAGPGVVDRVRIFPGGRERLLELVPMDGARHPDENQAAYRREGDELFLVLGHQVVAADGAEGAIDISLRIPEPGLLALHVNADQFDAMPSSSKGKYATCGWQAGVGPENSKVVRR